MAALRVVTWPKYAHSLRTDFLRNNHFTYGILFVSLDACRHALYPLGWWPPGCIPTPRCKCAKAWTDRNSLMWLSR